MYGTQTIVPDGMYYELFENNVKMYGTQTLKRNPCDVLRFENDVKMYGTQTCIVPARCKK